jgi:hypothetical protein
MAWLYLLFVLLVFYNPILGLAPSLLDKDIEITISDLSLPIPFTGSLKLLAYSLLTWWLLWTITHWIERRADFNIFYWLDERLPFLHLRERWLYATRPAFSIQLAVQLARIGFTISLIKMVGVLLLTILIAVIVPQLINADWLDGSLKEWLAWSAMKWLHEALNVLLNHDLRVVFTSSILILTAHKSYKKEQIWRYSIDIREIQQRRRQG